MPATILLLPTATSPKNPQRDVRNTVNEFQRITNKSDRWQYINLNPTAPTIRGLVKVHKEGVPIRPIVNWKNVPAYKLAKCIKSG